MKKEPKREHLKQLMGNTLDDMYYDAMEMLDGNQNDAKRAERLLLRALALDERNVQTRIGLVHAYGVLRNTKKAHEHIHKAFAETKRKFLHWPRKMEWGYIENRAYLRAIQYEADLLADAGEKEKAIGLYELLLRLNPNDNQGVRYTCAGAYAGITGEEVNKMIDEGNRIQNWDELENLVKRQNAEHHFWKEPKY